MNRVMLTAVEIELLLEEYEGAVFSRTGFPALDKASRELLQQIIDLTSCVKEKWCKKCFWITARCGDIQKYAEWVKKQGRREQFYQNVLETRFSEEEIFFHVKIRDENHMFIGNTMIGSTKEEYGGEDNLVPLLQWVKAGIEQVVAMLRAGTYRDYILEKLPYECRTGILPLSRYWTYVPQDKEELYAKLDAEELEEFLKWAEKEKNSSIGYEKMNANMFFEACLFLYKELGCEVGTMSAKEAYCKFSDGRDSGLTMLDENSYEEFEYWYATTHFDHVYDIKNNSVVFWISRLENGKYAFYLMHALDRGEYSRTDRLKIHLTLALLRAGYLLDVKAYMDMWRKYTGNCYVKIETWYQDYWGWLDFRDSGPRTQENRSLPKRPSKELLEETVWREPDICELEENK